MNKIIFTEPSSYNSKNKFVKQRSFTVTDDFYSILLKKPKSYTKYGISAGNAYVFGKKYPLNEYKKIRSHGNDGAQTGFINVKLWKDGMYSGEIANVNKKYDYSYDSRKNISEVRKLTNESVIFQGQTVGGDVGADLYAHYNSKKEVDSLIIDNYYFFLPYQIE
jgi:hypothetical protein